jgi:lysophospholipase L1-like esterase
MSADRCESAATAGPPPNGPPARLRRRLVSLILVASLSCNVLGAAYAVHRIARKGGARYLMERLDLWDAVPEPYPFQLADRARFEKLPRSDQDIVFLGDSLIAAGPWADFFSPIKNRGIGGETSADILERLGTVTAGQPRKLFLLVGTNDLAQDLPIDQIVRNHDEILARVRAESPATSVCLVGVPPVNQSLGAVVQSNADIRELNRRLADLVARKHAGVRFVDPTEALVDPDGNLRPDLTSDGLHLNIDGYLILERRLRDLVRETGAAPGG